MNDAYARCDAAIQKQIAFIGAKPAQISALKVERVKLALQNPQIQNLLAYYIPTKEYAQQLTALTGIPVQSIVTHSYVAATTGQ